jgi:hypothetical protein
MTGRGDRFTKSRRYHEGIPLDIEKRNKEEPFRIGKHEAVRQRFMSQLIR